MLVDTHCHLYEYGDEVPEVLERAREVGVVYVVAVSDDYESSVKSIELGRRYSSVLPLVGIHPWCCRYVDASEVAKLHELVEKFRDYVRGIGEVGLDRRFGRRYFDRQLEIFIEILKLARDHGLPLSIHCIKCEKLALDLLRKFDIDVAVFHWYQGSLKVLEEIVELGYYVSVNPSITYSRRSILIAKHAPLRSLLVESDSPYYFRGILSEPATVALVVKELAKLRNQSVDLIKEVLYWNSLRVFLR